MTKNSSTKDFKTIPKITPILKGSIFRSKIVKKFNPKNINFFTFNTGFKIKKDDLLIVVFSNTVAVSAVYSKTSTPSAPIIWDKKYNKGFCKILIVNSGNANAHTGINGLKAIDRYVNFISKKFDCPSEKILVSSTGVIGEPLDSDKIIQKLKNTVILKKTHLLAAAEAIMTTDTFPKTIRKKIYLGTEYINIYGISKGSGMIAPNMGTMLAYIFIEANIPKKKLNELLNLHIESSFNSITVDGDTSTSDTVMLFALGENKKKFKTDKVFYKKISNGLKDVMMSLAKQVVSDGEGISKLIKVKVENAKNYKQASIIAFSIGNSLLVKTAIAGNDANWGRIIMAIGKSNQKIVQEKIKLSFGNLTVAKNGEAYKKINIYKLNSYMQNNVIEINVDLGLGDSSRTIFSSDLTHEYVSINADYRS